MLINTRAIKNPESRDKKIDIGHHDYSAVRNKY